MNTRRKGNRAENELSQALEEAGYYVILSRASQGEFDVVAIPFDEPPGNPEPGNMFTKGSQAKRAYEALTRFKRWCTKIQAEWVTGALAEPEDVLLIQVKSGRTGGALKKLRQFPKLKPPTCSMVAVRQRGGRWRFWCIKRSV